VGKDLVVLVMGVILKPLVLVGDRPLLPVFIGRGFQLVVLHLMLQPLLLLLPLWELRLPGLTRAHPLVLVPVLVGTKMRMVVGPLMVLMQPLVLDLARLQPHGLVSQSSRWWWCLWWRFCKCWSAISC
jgi:hypothetical protein